MGILFPHKFLLGFLFQKVQLAIGLYFGTTRENFEALKKKARKLAQTTKEIRDEKAE